MTAALPAPSREPRRHAPLLLLAPAHSCSSVTVAAIGAHPDVYGFPLDVFDHLLDRVAPAVGIAECALLPLACAIGWYQAHRRIAAELGYAPASARPVA